MCKSQYAAINIMSSTICRPVAISESMMHRRTIQVRGFMMGRNVRRIEAYKCGVICLTRPPPPLTLGDLFDKRSQMQEIVRAQP